jgi:methylated-DNA-[protein]-cysteine S-methyltransferase
MATSSVILDSPIGRLLLVAEDGALTGLYMEPFPSPLPFALSAGPEEHLPFALSAGPQDRSRSATGDDPVLRAASEQLAAWFRGTLRSFDLPLRPSGTAFQQAVWLELRRIGYGETRTYGAIAVALGRPLSASRAVGAANGRNPLSIVVPCHRVIGASGALTGYAGGLARKRWLLDHERAVLAR